MSQKMTLETLENARQRMRTNADEIKKEINEKCTVFTVSYITKIFAGSTLFDYKETKTLETAQTWAKKYESEGFRCMILKMITTGFVVNVAGRGNGET